MDAAKGVKGQGRPLYAAPGVTMERGNGAQRSNSRRLARRVSEASQVWRSQTRMAGLDLLVTFGAMPKVTRRKGGTVIENTTSATDSLNSE